MSQQQPYELPSNVEERLRGLQDISQMRMKFVLNAIYDDMRKTNSYRGWKMLEVGDLLQKYLETTTALTTARATAPGSQNTANNMVNNEVGVILNDGKKRVESDLESLRSLEFSCARAKHLSRSREMWKRIGMALVAGTAVLVPMIVMTKGFPRSVNAAIVTVVISTVIFALFVAFTSGSTHQELLGVVATYAAVLVVFIGVSTP